MNNPEIQIPVDLTNPGQFFACCGMLELAGRVDDKAEGCFKGRYFPIRCNRSFGDIIGAIHQATVVNTMSAVQNARFEQLSSMSQKARENAGVEEERKSLESLWRVAPIIFRSASELKIDWFRDDSSGGSRFKTWAGRQSVLEIAKSMHAGLGQVNAASTSTLWRSVRGGGLPFNFDSDLGSQGSALDVGFSFDPLAASEATRIDGSCKPALEILAFIGLQRFRPREIAGRNRFLYVAWQQSMPASVAAALCCNAISIGNAPGYEFRLLYRTKYLKSFLPAIPFQGDDDARSQSA